MELKGGAFAGTIHRGKRIHSERNANEVNVCIEPKKRRMQSDAGQKPILDIRS